MARKNRAPRHDLAHRMRFVPANDGAWNHDLIEQETEELQREADAKHAKDAETAKKDGREPPKLPGDQSREHPWGRYQMGDTRFNLDDPELAKYIDQAANPEVWRIRRLGFEERATCLRMQAAGNDIAANWHAFVNGVMGLEGVEGDEAGEALAKVIKGLSPKRTSKQEGRLKDAVANYAMGAMADVGIAVITGSMDLRVDEGKLSASQPGD